MHTNFSLKKFEWPADFSMDPDIILYILIAIVVVDNLWDIILTQRQIIVCQGSIFVPEELRMVIPMDIYQRARVYEMHKAQLELWKHFINIIFGVVELYFGFYPFLWNMAKSVISKSTDKEIWISVIFMLLLSVYFVLRLLPVIIYDRCILEVRYGAYRQLSCLWFICLATCGLVVAQLILAPLTMLVVISVQLCGYFFFLYFWVISVLLTLLMLLIVPLCILPTIGKKEQVPEGPLHNELKKVTDLAGFPIERVYIVRTKSQIQYSNAYFFGSCCLKRIVIFDTLLLNKGLANAADLAPYEVGRGLTNPQIAGVVAHELGHWKNGHFYKSMIVVKFHFLITMVLFGLCFHWSLLYQAVGFKAGITPIIVGFIICFRFALIPYLTIANFLMLCNLRRYEYQADRYAHKLGYSLQLRGALLKIYADNMSFPVYDRCYSMWNHTHPSLLDRLHYQALLDMRETLQAMRNL